MSLTKRIGPKLVAGIDEATKSLIYIDGDDDDEDDLEIHMGLTTEYAPAPLL
jgi:hypothetical protein